MRFRTHAGYVNVFRGARSGGHADYYRGKSCALQVGTPSVAAAVASGPADTATRKDEANRIAESPVPAGESPVLLTWSLKTALVARRRRMAPRD